MLVGTVAAIAGIFGMNFETPYVESGVLGFWLVVGILVAIIIGATLVAQRKS